MSRIFSTALVAGLCLTLLPAAAAGAGRRDDEARIHFDQGLELFDAGEFEEAAIEFARAYQLKPSYRILYNLAQAENETRHYSRALEAYIEYMAEGGDEIDEERAEEVGAEIKRLNTLVGLVAVESRVAGATVSVDGEVRGTTPLDRPMFVDVGRHEILVQHGSRQLLRQVVRLAGGQKLKLNATPGAAPSPPPEDEPAETEEAGAEEEPSGEGISPGWFYGGLGLTVLLGAGAGVTWGLLDAAADDREEAIAGSDQDALDDANDRGQSLKPATIALLALTGASLVVTAILGGVADFDGEEPEGAASVAAAPVPMEGGAGLGVTGRF